MDNKLHEKLKVARYIRYYIGQSKVQGNFANHLHNLAKRLEKGMKLQTPKMQQNYEAFKTMMNEEKKIWDSTKTTKMK
jgi:hypothetical protein